MDSKHYCCLVSPVRLNIFSFKPTISPYTKPTISDLIRSKCIIIIIIGICLPDKESTLVVEHEYHLVVMYDHIMSYSKSMDQPGKVANPARGQLNRENEYLPVRARA